MPTNRETFQRLFQSKDARINLRGTHDVHEKQMNAIPKRFVQRQYYVHRLCNQKFTKAIFMQAKKASKKNIGHASKKEQESNMNTSNIVSKYVHEVQVITTFEGERKGAIP